MRSSIVEPFRKVLRPLIRWALLPHLGVRGEGNGVVPVNLKPPGTFVIVMSVIFVPIIALMLLPLFLILIPVVIVVGAMALLAPVFQGEVDGALMKPQQS